LLLTRGRRCGERRGAINMNDTSNTAAQLDQTDEEILTYTVSDEALEAAAGERLQGRTVGETYPWVAQACRYCLP
jgi:hypothetical protein